MELPLIAVIVVLILVVVAVVVILNHGASSPNTQNTTTTAAQNSSSINTTSTVASTTFITTTIPAGQVNVTPITNTSDMYTLEFGDTPNLGLYLTNGTGFALYLYTNDAPYNGTSACYGQCAKTWIPFYTSFLNVPSKLDSAKFGFIYRTDGRRQLTYRGYPLYLYAYDKASGQVTGNGVAGTWNVVQYPNATT